MVTHIIDVMRIHPSSAESVVVEKVAGSDDMSKWGP